MVEVELYTDTDKQNKVEKHVVKLTLVTSWLVSVAIGQFWCIVNRISLLIKNDKAPFPISQATLFSLKL